MQSDFRTNSNNEIQLGELFVTLWSHKFFIACICIISIFCSGYITLNTNKEYASSAVFKLNSEKPELGSSNFGALAKMTGFSVNSGNTVLPNDEVLGREFIVSLDQLVDFQNDQFFNIYNPNYEDPIWKTYIKNLIQDITNNK